MVLSINGVEMPAPTSMTIEYNAIGKAETNAAGDTIMDRLALKRSVSLSWGYLPLESASILTSAATDEHFLTAVIFDPKTSAPYEGTFYAEKMHLGAVRYDGEAPTGYADVSCDLAER